MTDLKNELKRVNPKLYAAYERSIEVASQEWMPSIPVKNDSHNAFPHISNIERYINTILFEEKNQTLHEFELSGSELYVMLCSILFHDIGKGHPESKTHAKDSEEIIKESWAELRIESEQFAKIISLISLFHDYEKLNENDQERLKSSLTNSMYVDHYGKIRARSIAALLFLADHMDGAYTRATPDYMNRDKKSVGLFRRNTQSVRIDLRYKMVCTVLEVNNQDEKTDFLNLIMKDVFTNNRELKKIRNELNEIGMPLKEWFIECNNILFRVEEKNEASKCYDYKKAFEPILDAETLHLVFKGMKKISSGLFGEQFFSYNTLLNYLRESKKNLYKVKCAVRRLKALFDSEGLDITIYEDNLGWSLKPKSNETNVEDVANKAVEIIAEARYVEKKNKKDNYTVGESYHDANEKPLRYNRDRSIILSDYLDLLLYKNINLPDDKDDKEKEKNWNRYSKYELFEFISRCKECNVKECIKEQCDIYKVLVEGTEKYTHIGGLILPHSNSRTTSESSEYITPIERDGSGNIIIVGGYGTGKSTLAFQMAAACADDINKGISIYYSLESTRLQTIENFVVNDEIPQKISPKFSSKLNRLDTFDKNGENDELTGDVLYEKLCDALENKDGKIEPQIVFPLLSPRGIEVPSAGSDLFIKRYKELEFMLKAVNIYNHKKENLNHPHIKLVVVDSLNVFSDGPLMREEINRLFDLFKRNNILGVFTLEDCVQEDLVGENYIGGIKYRADVVISLQTSYYNNHKQTFFEIEKSRNICPVAGRHLYKIRENNSKTGNIARKKLEVYPSLHYILSATDNKNVTQSPVKNFFGIDNLDNILPEYVKNSETRNPQVITIEGGSGLYKSDIAINALLHGMTQGENGMIIRLNDRDLFKDDGVRLSQSVFDELKDKNGKIIFIPDDESEPHQVSGYKIKSSLWKYKEQKLVEIVFKSGALLPEEFVDVVCRKINQHNIKRIAFIDLKNIGVSYPFLINSETSGSMFIPAFIHLMRNYRVHLIMSSSSSDLEESDREVRKASGLSDIIIKLTQDNKKNIIISCIGNIGSRSEYEIEKKPYSAACIYFKNDTDQNLINHTPKLDFFEVTEKKK